MVEENAGKNIQTDWLVDAPSCSQIQQAGDFYLRQQ
jgi:hypothetical protein